MNLINARKQFTNDKHRPVYHFLVLSLVGNVMVYSIIHL